MDLQRTLCNPQTVERFLTDALSGEESVAFEDHLEGCPSCRQRLEAAAAEGSWWEEARGYLASPTLPPGGAEPAGGARDEATSPLCGLEHYLAPTDDPRMLGRLGGYEVAGVVGCGGMGVVLKGWDGPLNRYVAIKVLAPHLALSAAARQRFAREARAAAAVVHDNVMAIHAVAEANGLPYFVMPYVRGPSLEKRLRESGALTPVEVLRIGRQIAAGLAAAHAQGLVHRDIKPANILLEEGVERVRITDFGLARAVDDASLTRSGVIAGTPQYMSPEQARGEAVDHRSDLFSLGSVLYALCTGRPPFRAGSTLAVLRRVEEDRPRPIREINPDTPDGLARVIERLQAKDPAERFQSAAEVAALLERYLAHLQQPATIPAPDLPPPRDGGRPALPGSAAGGARWLRHPLWAAAVLLAVLAPGMALWLAGGAGEARPGTKSFQEYYLPLRGIPENVQTLERFGPDADQCVKFERDGLRITLPPGYPGDRPPTGLATGLTVKGDFDITVHFEILKEPEPEDAGSPQTRFTLVLVPDRPEYNEATLSRRVELLGGTQFLTWLSLWDPESGTSQRRMNGFPTQAKAGRLRLVRRGPELSYYVSEGPDEEFTLLEKYPLGEDDLRDVRVDGSTGGHNATLDVRLTDLRIRAASLPNLPPATSQQARWKLWLAAGFVLILPLTLAVSLWLFLRQGRRAGGRPAPAPVPDGRADPEVARPSVSFPCSGCARNLRARADLAGKKVKCPQCGRAVLVPAIKPAAP